MAKQSLKYRDEDRSLDLYLREIGETPLINADEEVRLARRIKQGDKRALEKLTKANLRFVVSVAKQYQNQGLSLADLINDVRKPVAERGFCRKGKVTIVSPGSECRELDPIREWGCDTPTKPCQPLGSSEADRRSRSP